MLEMPVTVAWLSRLYEAKKLEALFEMTGGLSGDNLTDEQLVQRRARMLELWEQWFQSHDYEARQAFATEKGEALIDDMFSTTKKYWPGLGTVLLAQITGMWTAFETLAGDIWIAAVNAHPDGLAELKGRKNRISKQAGDTDATSDQSARGQDDSKKEVKLGLLRSASDGTYNLANKMGTALSERFSFSKLSDIRAAYSLAFWKDSADIDKALANKAVNSLNAVRNLIVHQAGLADEKYVKQLKRSPFAPQLKKGERLIIDGVMTQTLIAPALACAIELLYAADKWLSVHQ